jgi:hypothetical protein
LRRTRTASTGIYDEVGAQRFLVLLSSAVSQDDASDTVMVRAQLRNLAGVPDAHIVPGSQLLSHVLLKEWSALEQDFEGTPNGCHPDTKLIPTYIFHPYRNRTVLGECRKEVGKVLPYDGRSTRQQPMNMSSLRYPLRGSAPRSIDRAR